LWWEAASARLGPTARARIADPESAVFVSAASAWEISVKIAVRRLEVSRERALAIDEEGFLELPITIAHAVESAQLPWHHRDPFDRLLIAQARIEDLTLVAADDRLRAYEVEILDAAA
jgi:PIN domain nuclease of toxin-antitoxin system